MGAVVCKLLSLYCRSGCQASVVASALTFHPPEPLYEILEGKSAGEYHIELSPDLPRIPDYRDKLTVDIIATKTKTKIPIICFQTSGAKFTIIYSHGNATDCGAMYGRFMSIAMNLRVNVIGYDYTGYGISAGTPTERQTYKDIEAVYDWCITKKIVTNPARELILYGQSVGSGPSCYLASNRAIAGLIIHSGILSGIRVLTQSRALACFDIYPNIDRIKEVKCPTFIIHGEDDREVTFTHGKGLYDAAPEGLRADPWWVSGRGHNDILAGNETIYFQKLNAFIASI